MADGECGYFFIKQDYSSSSNYLSDDRYGFIQVHGRLNKYVPLLGERISIRDFEDKIIQETKFPKLTLKNHVEIFSIQAFGDRDTCDILPLTRNVKSIEFTFDSVRYTPDLQYLEFDIMAKVNTPGLKFGKGDLFIRYDKSFGENVVTKGSVEITKGEIIQNSLYDLQYDDYSENSIYVSADSEFGSNQMYTFTSTAAELLHVKVKIDDFTQIGSISFDSIDISGSVYYWCRGDYNLFDQVNLDAPIISVESNTPIGITYTFENGHPINNNTQFKIDIMAEATNTSQYSGGNVEVTYNTGAFGSNVISSGSATFERGPLISDASVYTSHFVQDVSMIDNVIQIFTFSDPAITSGRTTLGTSKIRLGTLTFDIEDCGADKGIAFDQIGTIDFGNHIHYTGSMPVPNENYDPIIADDTETGKVCGCSKPIITSFSPSTIHAGTGEILTITGQNFGNFSQLESTILFPNGDDGGFSMMEAGMKDFEWNGVIHWSDTEIKIKVPSTDKNEGADNPACTGKFQVRNECDISDKSDDLLITYALLNARSGQFSEAYKMTIQENSSPGICFQFTDDTPGWIIDQFENALNNWCNETGINFSIGSSVSSNTELEVDDINVIKYGGQNSSTGGGMAIQGQYYNSICNSAEIGWVFKEIDFIVYSGFGDPSTQEAQLREVIGHELGHSHMLAHARNNTALDQPLMHYEGNFNGTITTVDAEGANLVFANSQAIVSSCGTPIGSGNCGGSCSPNYVHDFNSSFNVLVSPNPSSGIVDISFGSDDNAKIDFIEVVNINGVIVQRFDLKYNIKQISIELPNQSGVYMLKVFSDKLYSISKVIKL